MIEFINVHKYLGGRHILRGIEFDVKKGETFVIVGPTGTGKSVTLRHIAGLLRPDGGRVTVKGEDMGAMSRKKLSKLRSGLGMLFQSGALLNWMTIKDNVALPLRDRGTMSSALINEKVMNVLEILGLKDDCQKMPSDISGGMRKRAGLARAVVTDPEIVLYDEPTSGLDPIMSRKIDKLVVSLKNRLNITSVVVTHDLLSAFNVADRIAMLADGKIQVCGTVKEFKDTDNPRVRAFINAFSAGIDGKEGFYA